MTTGLAAQRPPDGADDDEMLDRSKDRGMLDVRGEFWVKQADFPRLHAAPRLCYLIGGYDGSGNYGDILQLAANLRRVARTPHAPLAVPLVDVRHARNHHDLVREHPAFFGGACILYYALENDNGDEPGEDPRALGLVAVEYPPTRASQLLVYGGGFFVAGQRWGAQKLDLIETVERWLDDAGSLSHEQSSILVVGQQVSEAFLCGAESARFRALFQKAYAFGVRDDLSFDAVERGIEETGQRLFFSGDDAASYILESGWTAPVHLGTTTDDVSAGNAPAGRFKLGIHLSFEDYVTSEPETLLALVSSVVRRVHDLVDGDLVVTLLVAYDERRISERRHFERLMGELDDLGVAVNERDVLRLLADGGHELRDADLVVACSYHVGLTSMLLAVPTLLVYGNDSYAHKVEGLRRTFGLTDRLYVDTREIAEDELQPLLARMVADRRFLTSGCSSTARGIARMAVANARAAALVDEFVAGGRAADAEGKYRAVMEELRETMERLSDLQFAYARLLNAGPRDAR